MHSRCLFARTEVPAGLISRAFSDTVHRSPRGKKDQESGRSTGFTDQKSSESWAVGFWRTDHANRQDGRRLDDVLHAFEASRSRRGDKERDDKKFLSALHYFVLHNITWRALQESRPIEVRARKRAEPSHVEVVEVASVRFGYTRAEITPRIVRLCVNRRAT